MRNVFNAREDRIIRCCFVACLATMCLCILFFAIYTLRSNYRINQETQQLQDMLSYYISSATDEEYYDIARRIRHDSILSANTKNFIQYIPNRSMRCPASRYYYDYPVYILAVNTGELYALNTEPSQQSGSTYFKSGYDDISQSTLSLIFEDEKTYAVIKQNQDIISIHKMKKTFCDDCIEKIVAAIDNQPTTAFVIFVPQEQAIYPINSGLAINNDNYSLTVNYDLTEDYMLIEYQF